MATAKKIEKVGELQELFQRANLAIATDYRGLNTADLTALRRRLREAKVEYHVVKNTLATRAAEQAERRELPGLLTGPTALALGFGDAVEAAKSLTDYIRTSRINLPIRGALLGARLLQAAQVQTLATLPPREVLLGQFVGGLNGPIVGLVTVLNELLASLVRVLDARATQMGGAPRAEAAPVAAAPEPEPERSAEQPFAEAPGAEAPAQSEPAAEASTEEEPAEPA